MLKIFVFSSSLDLGRGEGVAVPVVCNRYMSFPVANQPRIHKLDQSKLVRKIRPIGYSGVTMHACVMAIGRFENSARGAWTFRLREVVNFEICANLCEICSLL